MIVSSGWCVAQQPVPKASTPAMQAKDSWMSDLARRHQKLIDDNGPGTDTALREQLLRMRADDQAAPERGLTKVDAKDRAQMEASANRRETDTRLTTVLKEIVARDGWPTIPLVGYDASQGAMLVLAHTPDHAWQLSLLPQLETLADEGKIDGAQLALVIDKELIGEGKLQRYGTQFKVADGEMAMYGVEDPAGLDQRRALVFLMPEEAYKRQLTEMYHLKAGNKIVMVQVPVK